MDVGRFLRLIESKKMTQKDLAEAIGVSRQAINHYATGKREPSSDMLTAIANFFEVSTDYLLGRDNPVVERNVMPLNIDAVIGIKIPVLGSVPAGIPIEANENIVEYIEIPESWLAGGKHYFGLIVHGDSMYPEYLDGDIIVVRIQEDCESGDDCVVYVNGDYEATFKRVEKLENGYIRLKPLNSAYNPVTYTQQQVIDLPVRIAGVAVELRRKKK